MNIYPIEIKNISFGYGEKNVFENISLDISKGEMFFLMGRNGCGKSSLIDSILNINKINSGEIKINGKRLENYSPSELATKISYVPQSHEKSFPYTVRQVVLMGRTVYSGAFGSYSQKDKEIVDNIMKKVGIYHLAERPYILLSGGEIQMVMLARALAQDTNIIILDEPTAHLDFYNELLFMESILRLSKSEGKTIIIASHNPNHAFYAEKKGARVRVGLMADGKIDIIDSPSKALTSKNIRLIYNINSQILSSSYQNTIIPLNTI